MLRLVFSAKRTGPISHLYDLAKTNLHCHSTIYKSILISLKVYYLSLNNHFFSNLLKEGGHVEADNVPSTVFAQLSMFKAMERDAKGHKLIIDQLVRFLWWNLPTRAQILDLEWVFAFSWIYSMI